MRCSERCAIAGMLALVLLAGARPAGAEHLGVIGPVHEIAEPDLLAVIRGQLETAQRNGKLARLQREASERVRRNVEMPPPVPGVSRTRSPRTFFVDPSIEIRQPVADTEGRVIVTPGTHLNPLATVSLSKRLIFFDGRDASQVKQVEQRFARGEILKPILVAGAPLDLIRKWKRPVFFDQGGALIARVGIRHVPALVSQDGLRLRIDEVR